MPSASAMLDALGDAFDELIAVLTPWGRGHPRRRRIPPQGPHDLAAGGRG